MAGKFTHSDKPRRMRLKPVGSTVAHLDDAKVSGEERRERFIKRYRSTLPELAAIHDSETARILRRFVSE